MNAFFLAVSYLRFHWARSLVLVLAVALILAVPVASRALLNAGEATLTARAETTPYLVGRRGSALDLTMAALYFGQERPPTLPAEEVDRIWDSGAGVSDPAAHPAFETGGQAESWGTYAWDISSSGRLWRSPAGPGGLPWLGEAGARGACGEALGAAPGDTVVSNPAEPLRFSTGGLPLEMGRVVRHVARSHRHPDDEAVLRRH